MTEKWAPFLGQEAIASGRLTEWELRTNYRRIYQNVYFPIGVELTAADRAFAAWLWSRCDATLVGLSAAAVHGTQWIDGGRAAELCRLDRRHPPGIAIRTYAIPAEDLCWIDGMRLTTPERTALDIGRLAPDDKSIPLLDALLRATGLNVEDVRRLADRRPGLQGGQRLRTALCLVDSGAESPQESRLRVTLVRGGLPRPDTQIPLSSEDGCISIRLDMGWPRWKLAVEYDGVQHWSDPRQRSWDIERIAFLESIGWVVVRVGADQLRRPSVVIERVARKLRERGWTG